MTDGVYPTWNLETPAFEQGEKWLPADHFPFASAWTDLFFGLMAGLILLTVFIGFARTHYLAGFTPTCRACLSISTERSLRVGFLCSSRKSL